MASSLLGSDNIATRPIEKPRVTDGSLRVPRKIQWRAFRIALISSDIIMMVLAFQAAYIVRFELNLAIFNLWVVPSLFFYRVFMVCLIPIWLAIFAGKGLYNKDFLLGGTEEYSRLFNAITIGAFVVIIASFISNELYLARAWLFMSWAFSFLFIGLGRFVLRRLVYYLRGFGYFLRPAIILGANDEGLMLAEQLLQWKTSGFDIKGFIDKKIKPGTMVWRNLCCLGDLNQIDEILNEYDIEELILASSAISSRDKMVEIFKRYGVSPNIKVRLSSGLYEIVTTGLTVNQFAYVPLVGIDPVRLTGMDKVFKLLLDYAITIPGVILISPLLLIITIIVKLDSKGPVIHKRRVVGVNGAKFDAFKFRTMLVNGDEILSKHPDLVEELANNHKLKHDPRLTRVGGFLRKYSLDELPQLFNVLRREMSLVGPRMITEQEMQKYDKWDLNLLTVRPGITGLWQVSGRSNISYEERVRLDMYYIRNWTIWLDFQLLLQTIPAVIRGKGAY
jgi:exopolysaccharide biosynthesis polyprenyl glycosylphosphotransferase